MSDKKSQYLMRNDQIGGWQYDYCVDKDFFISLSVLVLRIIVESARLEERRVTQHAPRGGGLEVTQTNGATRDKKILH